MKRRDLIHSLPIVAIALGHKYKVKVVIRGDQARTDGDTIILPSLPLDNADAAVLAYGYLDHEAAHVRLSDFECFANCQCPIERDLLNILEDIRIELRMSRLYPGCRSNLDRLTQKLVKDGVFGLLSERDSPISILHGYVLYRLRLEVLGQRAFSVLSSQAKCQFVRLFPEALTRGIDRLLAGASGVASTQESLALAREMIRLIKEQAEEPRRNEKIGRGSLEQRNTNRKDNRPDLRSNTGENPQTATTAQGQGNVSRARSSCSQPSQSSNGKLPPSADCGETESGPAEASCPNSSSHCQLGPGYPAAAPSDSGLEGRNFSHNVRNAIKDVLNSNEKDIPPDFGTLVSTELESLSAAAPTGTPPSPSTSVSPSEARDPCLILNKIRIHTRALRTRLEGALQTSCRERIVTRRVGARINPRSLHRIIFPDPKLFMRRIEKRAVNTAVHILLDCSRSMAVRELMDDAIESTLALATALDSIPRVRVACAAFPGPQNDQVVPLTRFGESVRETAKYYPPLTAHGGTPLAEALWWVAAQILMRTEERKLIVVITDGEPNSPEAARDILSRCRCSGIECVGVGIQDMCVTDLFQDYCIVNQIEDLAPSLFEVLRRKLTKDS